MAAVFPSLRSPLRSPLRSGAICLALAVLVGCDTPDNGSGGVQGRFFVLDCRPSGAFGENCNDDETQCDPSAYSWDAAHLSTKRFEDSLQIVIQKHKVTLEQGDGLVVHIEDLRPLRAMTQRPIVVPITTSRDTPSTALSLFDTCPNRPTLNMLQGELRFEEFEIAAEPDGTGVDEALRGTLTGTIVTIDGVTIAGTLSANFDFRPGRRPVSEPQ